MTTIRGMIVNPSILDELDETERLLFGYAAGMLDEAMQLMAAAYAAVNEQAQETLYYWQSVGGALMEELNPATVSTSCLEQLMARLDAEECDKGDCGCPALAMLPAPLRAYLGDCAMEELKWRKFVQGVEYFPVVKPRRAPTRAELMRLHPGVCTPGHKNAGREYTLVLQGAMQDGTVHFRRGDLTVRHKGEAHLPASCPEQGCLTLTVVEGASLPDVLHRLLKMW